MRIRPAGNLIALTLALAAPGEGARAEAWSGPGLRLQNGWFVHEGRVVWGYAQHNGWWRPGGRPNITRRAPGEVGPNRTEDLDKLTDNMLRCGYPGFEHNFGLWYDRRRDAHDAVRRADGNVVPPFLEQPWARSDVGTAWDGLPRYDLTKYNRWYFRRLKEFAAHCDRKGTILFHNFYMQHALLEIDAHYVDFAWRPANCAQSTDMPDRIPAADAFYDVSPPLRRELHRAYIRKCLDELGDHSNVVHLLSQEYTGPISFVRFWLDVISEWETKHGKNVLAAVGGTKDVLDALAGDPRVSVLDLRYWWYTPDGAVHAPPGGRQVAGRYVAGRDSARTTPWQIHRQMKEYRLRYPNKGIIHAIEASRQQTFAFLMGGGSMLIRYLQYEDGKDPQEYETPPDCRLVRPIYDFINGELSSHLQEMVPQDLVVNDPEQNWCLGDAGRMYLVYLLAGGEIRLDLTGVAGRFKARWVDPRSGALQDASRDPLKGGAIVSLTAPSADDWLLWLAIASTSR